MYKVQFKSSARLRLAGDAKLIKRLVFRALGAGGKLSNALPTLCDRQGAELSHSSFGIRTSYFQKTPPASGRKQGEGANEL